MPSLIGTTVTSNYLKTSPGTQFGTRALRIIKVAADDSGDSKIDLTKQKFEVTGPTAGAFVGSYTDSDSFYSAAVRAVQTVAEIYAIGQPDATSFIVVVSYDTANDSGAGTNANDQDKTWSDLESVITDSLVSRLGDKTPVAGAGFVYNGVVTVTAIDVAGGAQNFVGGAIGSLV